MLLDTDVMVDILRQFPPALAWFSGMPQSSAAVLIAAALPDPADQEAAGAGPPPTEPPSWPWTADALRARLAEARSVLAVRS